MYSIISRDSFETIGKDVPPRNVFGRGGAPIKKFQMKPYIEVEKA